MRHIECSSSLGSSTLYLEGPIEDASGVIPLSNWHNEQPRVWRYRVHLRNPPQPEDDFYEAVFIEIDENTILSMTLACNRSSYRGKGITPEVFASAARDLGRKIISSTSGGLKYFKNESRTEDATRVWYKLKASGLASFDAVKDRFEYIPAERR